jgi:hypothetical protein
VLEDGDMRSILEKADLPVRPGGDESSAQKEPRQDSDPRSHDEGRNARLRARWFPGDVGNGSILSHPRLPRAVEPYDDEGFPAISIRAGYGSLQDQGGASDVLEQSAAGLLDDLSFAKGPDFTLGAIGVHERERSFGGTRLDDPHPREEIRRGVLGSDEQE